MTIVESYLSSRAFQKALETPLLRQLARIMIGVILVYFTIRFLDLSGRGALPLLLDGSMEAGMMWIELLFMLVLPLVLFNIKNWGHSRQGLFFTGISFVIGFVTNRLNTTMTAIERYYNEQFGMSYFPSVGELAVTIAIVTMGFVLFGLAVKYLDIFPHYVEEEEAVIDLATGKTQHLAHGEVLPKTS
jgi:Ni/Fe-hydrogenase subunit HybB-like protein